MRTIVLSIRDRAADAFGRPFFAVSRPQGIRSFTDEVNKKQDGNMFNQHPEDFDLYELGEFSDGDGLFVTGVPVCVCRAQDVKI